MTTASGDPFDTANEADVAEQAQEASGDDSSVEPDVSTDEADVADLLEQGVTVAGEDDEDYPHESS